MAVLDLPTDDEFTPKWNEEQGITEEPVVFVLRPLTYPERERYMPMKFSDGGASFDVDKVGLFKAGVTKVVDLVVFRGGERRDLTKAIQVLETPALINLVDEVVGEIMSRNAKDEVALKN